jgi:6-pyruvoyltetrahydropterin/6-carboxytetrahydropterin synthase
MYQSTKTYGHDIGLSCAFRQWRANDSHCSKIHGYSLAFKFVFECSNLDDKNWAVDFGGLKSLKKLLELNFDHKTAVAEDDPYLYKFKELHNLGMLDLTILPSVGCEKFAEHAFNLANSIVEPIYGKRVRLVSCEVMEHGANSAIYLADVPEKNVFNIMQG